MQSIKNTSIILIVLFLLTIFAFAKPIEKRKLESYTKSYYLNFLDNVLVPNIEEYIDTNPIKAFNEQNGQRLINGIIYEVIQPHIASDNVMLLPYTIYLKGMPSKDGTIIRYILSIPLTFVQYDERGKMVLALKIELEIFCGLEVITEKKNI